jgi:hypothetical protein
MSAATCAAQIYRHFAEGVARAAFRQHLEASGSRTLLPEFDYSASRSASAWTPRRG